MAYVVGVSLVIMPDDLMMTNDDLMPCIPCLVAVLALMT